ncbi:MAG: sensor histidine kinase, partial [Bryobacteraceae bacterium]
FSMVLLAAALVIALIGTVLTIRVVSRIYRQLQWQAEELSHLSSRTMADQEATARRFSRELHDEFGQNLSAIEANLVAMQNAGQFHVTRMEDCLALVKQAIENTRELSQLLRPSVLDDFGLDASLRWLADGFSQRTGIAVDYQPSPVERLSDETETQLFRIFQEALTNVSRHANATAVRVELKADEESLSLVVADNGQGILSKTPGGGLGLIGMRARARAAGGSVALESNPGQGVTVRVELPLTKKAHEPKDPHPAR